MFPVQLSTPDISHTAFLDSQSEVFKERRAKGRRKKMEIKPQINSELIKIYQGNILSEKKKIVGTFTR